MFEYTSKRREMEQGNDWDGLAHLEAPDLLQTLWSLEAFDWKHLPWPGGLEDQPHLLWFELDCAREALALQKRLETQQAAVLAAAGSPLPTSAV